MLKEVKEQEMDDIEADNSNLKKAKVETAEDEMRWMGYGVDMEEEDDTDTETFGGDTRVEE
ncbi:hypothetical protein E2C01_048562 [Portunus trituberculatus]|uniref:Uncharacterized protein n=1 Tax=Portunus trituberculatus TaxID=210409 RepID=A0A5B7GAJ9_PORTR|nr:hypothetical protein [Portunus trituberculatus]